MSPTGHARSRNSRIQAAILDGGARLRAPTQRSPDYLFAAPLDPLAARDRRASRNGQRVCSLAPPASQAVGSGCQLKRAWLLRVAAFRSKSTSGVSWRCGFPGVRRFGGWREGGVCPAFAREGHAVPAACSELAVSSRGVDQMTWLASVVSRRSSASRRELTLRRRRAFLTCVRTVWGESTRSSAIWSVPSPSW
jgi:hypothetical protein